MRAPSQWRFDMAAAKDVAQYILEQKGTLSAIKLQKLVYYCQAWCLVWTGKPLFEDQVQAWANGPVVPSLYRLHQGQLDVSPEQKIGNSDLLSTTDRLVIDSVLPTYGDKEPFWLVELTHLEEPWKQARQGYFPGERCIVEITHAAMAEYYSGLING